MPVDAVTQFAWGGADSSREIRVAADLENGTENRLTWRRRRGSMAPPLASPDCRQALSFLMQRETQLSGSG
jgi:hypothetical protein